MRALLALALCSLPLTAIAQDAPFVNEQDTNGDGVVDWRVTVWSSDAGIVREDVDEGADGTIEQRMVGTYDDNGALLSWLVDQGADGTYERSTFYTNDALGRRIRIEADTDGDGVVDVQRVLDAPCAAPYGNCDLFPTC